MGIITDIEWCDSSLNLMMGCNGCELWIPKSNIKTCYAGRITEQYGGRNGWPESFDKPKTFIKRLDTALNWSDLTGTDRPDKPWLNGYPRTIFLNDMGDPFTESLPLMWLAPLVPKMAESPHIYISLTKRPRRMFEFFEQIGYIPDNFWLLVSVTDQRTYDKRKPWLYRLQQIKEDAILGLSIEPLLGPIDLMSTPHWVIVGGESGPNPRPAHRHWFALIRDQCQLYGVPFFFKQWGGNHKTDGAWGGRKLDGRTWNEMPETKPVEQYQQAELF